MGHQLRSLVLDLLPPLDRDLLRRQQRTRNQWRRLPGRSLSLPRPVPRPEGRPRGRIQGKRVLLRLRDAVAADPPLVEPARERNPHPAGRTGEEIVPFPGARPPQAAQDPVDKPVAPPPAPPPSQFHGIVADRVIGNPVHLPHLVEAHPEQGTDRRIDPGPGARALQGQHVIEGGAPAQGPVNDLRDQAPVARVEPLHGGRMEGVVAVQAPRLDPRQ